VLNAEEGRAVLSVRDGERRAVETLSTILGSDLSIEGVSIQPPSLNSLFLKLTGRELRD